MALRWRYSGELLCAAKTQPYPDDTYIEDNLHYKLAVQLRVIIPDENEEINGKWYWIDELGLRGIVKL